VGEVSNLGKNNKRQKIQVWKLKKTKITIGLLKEKKLKEKKE